MITARPCTGTRHPPLPRRNSPHQPDLQTDTLAKLLWEHTVRDGGPSGPYRLPAGATVIIDEAGMVATNDLHTLARLADTHRWNVVLVGDGHQLSAVGRGGMFDCLVTSHPGDVQRLGVVQRFTEPWERDASLALASWPDRSTRHLPTTPALHAGHGRRRRHPPSRRHLAPEQCRGPSGVDHRSHERNRRARSTRSSRNAGSNSSTLAAPRSQSTAARRMWRMW